MAPPRAQQWRRGRTNRRRRFLRLVQLAGCVDFFRRPRKLARKVKKKQRACPPISEAWAWARQASFLRRERALTVLDRENAVFFLAPGRGHIRSEKGGGAKCIKTYMSFAREAPDAGRGQKDLYEMTSSYEQAQKRQNVFPRGRFFSPAEKSGRSARALPVTSGTARADRLSNSFFAAISGTDSTDCQWP